MGALAGPSPIARNGQVVVPKNILRALGWSAGDQISVMFSVDDSDPGVVSLVPIALFERRYRRGEAIDKLERITDRGDIKRAQEQQ